MLFQTQLFLLVFFPATLGLFFLVSARANVRIAVLIAASLVFYGWWDARFVPLLIGQAVFTWLFAELYFRIGSRALLWLAIAANLAVLALFKYADFIVGNVEAATGLSLPRSTWILPIGISFFTFELISYLADQLRGREKRYGFSRFLLFVLFFPRLIAGPIVRHDEIIGQFDADPRRPGVSERLGKGFVLLVIGLAKKVLIADQLAGTADTFFAAAAIQPQPLFESWIGTLAFTLQLYFDFSAYTDMAMGMSLMMGFVLPPNFDAPYRSTSIRSFWRRWHMTLSRYIRDYLYIPLGGSRNGGARYVLATMASMSLCGLWHGAGWTFILWGAMHGAGLITCRVWQGFGLPLPAPLAWVLTMLFVMAGWVLFRSPDFSTALSVFTGLAGQAGIGSASSASWIMAAGAAAALLGPTSLRYVHQYLLVWRSAAIFWAAVFVYCLLAIGGRDPTDFIYFQF